LRRTCLICLFSSETQNEVPSTSSIVAQRAFFQGLKASKACRKHGGLKNLARHNSTMTSRHESTRVEATYRGDCCITTAAE
jgi:hypothetical protein